MNGEEPDKEEELDKQHGDSPQDQGTEPKEMAQTLFLVKIAGGMSMEFI